MLVLVVPSQTRNVAAEDWAAGMLGQVALELGLAELADRDVALVSPLQQLRRGADAGAAGVSHRRGQRAGGGVLAQAAQHLPVGEPVEQMRVRGGVFGGEVDQPGVDPFDRWPVGLEHAGGGEQVAQVAVAPIHRQLVAEDVVTDSEPSGGHSGEDVLGDRPGLGQPPVRGLRSPAGGI